MNLRRGRSRTLVIGFLQERKSLKPVVKSLRRGRFFRSAIIQVGTDGKPSAAGWIASRYLAVVLIGACMLLAAVIGRIAVVGIGSSEMWLHALAILLAGLAGGWAIARLVDTAVARSILALHRRWVLAGETLVVVSTRSDAAASAVTVISETAGEHPAVFVLHPPEESMRDPAEHTRPAPGEDEVHRRAASLAAELQEVDRSRPRHRSLTPRLAYCEKLLGRVQDQLSGAVRLEHGIALSAEWLLDNAYIIRGHVEDFRRNLPAKYYRELPFLAAGQWRGYPRVYAIVCELVADWDGALTKQRIESFLQAYQSQTTLTTAELWAFPLMLRLRLIEFLASLSVEVGRRQLESENAAFWANRLLYAVRRDVDRMPEVLAAVAAECPHPSPHVVEELLDNLYAEEAALTPVRAWLQTKFPAPLEEVLRQHEQIEASDQTSLANSISTLRLLSQFDWREVFEAVSRVEAILWTDPAATYGRMDFETRDRYRHQVEKLSRRRGILEEQVADAVIELARAHSAEPENHVGYYVVDDGLPKLEQHLRTRPSVREALLRWVNRHPGFVYLGWVVAGTAFYVFLALSFSRLSASPPGLKIALGLLFFLPAAELAVQTVNYVVTRSIQPRPLPKMSFDDGIPDEFRTLVVVPMMLLTPESIREEVERLEIRALANPDPNLVFGLLSDYSDAPNQHMPEDLELLDVARLGIETLNERHGTDRFLLFSRERKWSEGEQRWMGWERKRGKLEQLNQFLMTDPEGGDEVKIGAGSPEAVALIRFVITLDSDTQLPRDTARRLVATLAHPLNRPLLTPDGLGVTRGYTIIQPRVSTSLPSATASLFSRIFTDPTGVDPYTHAVSDVYQDLSGSGTYHGKGIYDLEAFHRVLSKRFPEGHLLSHDLIEGAFAQVALASDIELLDLFPGNYADYCSREHRWIRGDWQIVDWLLPTVPSGRNRRERNPLSLLRRWKIFDNLRRSLSPVAILAMLVGGCAISPNAVDCALMVVPLLLAPLVFPLLTRLTQKWVLDPILWREPGLNFTRILLFASALPHQAWLSVNAIVRVFYRRLVTHRHLLEWATATGAGNSPFLERARQVVLRLAWAPVFAVGALAIVGHAHPHEPPVMLPFAILWVASPIILAYLDHPIGETPARGLPAADRAALRSTARRTWRFFDDFMGAKTHYLPPDNFQQSMRVELAERTSPTNIGLYLVSALAANDLGYITLDDLIERVHATMGSIRQLERYRGHLLNWYDTSNLQPLGERYVSTVDSGNLMGALWALRQGLQDLAGRPLLGPQLFQGLADSLAEMGEYKSADLAAAETAAVARLIAARPTHLSEIVGRLRELAPLAAKLSKAVTEGRPSEQCLYWSNRFQAEIAAWNGLIDRYFSWVDVLEAPPETGILSLGSQAHAFRRAALSHSPSLRTLASGPVEGLSDLHTLRRTAGDLSPEIHDWAEALAARVEAARAAAKERHDLLADVQLLIENLDNEMDMRFLYDPERRLFATGYNVAEQRLERSYYDLLASEARLSSFLAIARGEVPTEHWWSLGRPYGLSYLKRPLLSWSGTMFEYLMPLLLTKSFANSLLDRACRVALECQVIYARRRGIPWGISESAYSALDSRQVYQYRAFGVPGLALKRGLEEDFVVSPYSSALALAVDPNLAAKNLRKSGPLARLKLRGDYGFYEAIDFTRHHGPHGERGLVVHTFMAHHQGMTLVAIDNVLSGNIMRERFHADPRVKATASLLYERIPVAPRVVYGQSREAPIVRLAPIVAIPAPGRVDTPHTSTPRTCLLSNGEYKVMVTAAGGGYSRWRGFDVTRWRADTTCDDWGRFCYLKDLESGFVWSIAHHPTRVRPASYRAVFSAEKAEIRRRDRGIETIAEVVVSPEDDAEIWRLTVINRSSRHREIELTTYTELALAPHATDRAHPAFNKLFIETAMVRDLDALLAWRRTRSPDEPQIWLAQLFGSSTRSHEPTPFETDRARFIGRGRTLCNPAALEGPLSGSEGYVLDPIFSLRKTISLPPGDRVQIALVTIAAATRDQALALATKYRDLGSTDRAISLAWTQAQLEFRHLRMKPADAQLYQQLAGHILYPHFHLRAPPERIVKNRLGQRSLWAYGISGDLPIVVMSVDDPEHLDAVEELLAAHTFWHVRGLTCDLVILNEEAASYDQPLHAQLQRMIVARSHFTGVDRPGGVFLRPARQIGPEDLTLILAAASIVLVAARGPLSQQIGAPAEAPAPPRVPRASAVEEPSPGLSFLELAQFNGMGGFTQDGGEYAVYLGKDAHTPRPWSNVIANPGFGALVTDEGGGFAWYGNSQSNRLIPWSNDPICDPASDAIYIFDPELNALWAPSPHPIRENDPYRARHGFGYTVSEHNSHAIEQELTTFVPVDEAGGLPVRIQILKLTNRSSRQRKLRITFYAEWVLGGDRESSQANVVTSWDLESRSLMARNSFNLSYGDSVAFAASSLDPQSFSGDRTEILGRNGSMANPTGLQFRTLSGHVGGGFDPCAALQMQITLEPGATSEAVFFLGAARSPSEVRQILRDLRAPGRVAVALQATRDYWSGLTHALTVETHDSAADLLLNGWLLYQVLSCRIWGRSALYQSGGAYGFRDQLQDVLALAYSRPEIAREQILRSAGRQFVEGDVQHWWHPESGAGVRTRISDDLLWLPYAATQYVRVTGDSALLDEQVPFIEGPLLDKGEHDAYFTPEVSGQTATVWQHCRKAIEKASTAGQHGLPLIGAGDWNDGLNLVGAAGKGESVWLAWFLVDVLRGFAELTASRDVGEAARMTKQAGEIVARIEKQAWDGDWYLRAFFDDGTPLGSKTSPEAQIDSLPQSWAAIAGGGKRDRAEAAMRAVEDRLVMEKDGIVRLFDPPFDSSPLQPGYIKGYPPGVRENGGQYTHGSLWAAMAWARLGRGAEAVRLLDLMNPIRHGLDPDRYLVEPYVAAADVYALPGRIGMGGWTWYTGSAAWMYRIWIEEILGFKLRGSRLTIEPCIPPEWAGFKMRYRFGRSLYSIEVSNPKGATTGVRSVKVDGTASEREIDLVDDGASHEVRIVMGRPR